MEQIERENDQILKCNDCGSNYVLTPGERHFFLDRGLHFPKRCPECRRRRREGVRHE